MISRTLEVIQTWWEESVKETGIHQFVTCIEFHFAYQEHQGYIKRCEDDSNNTV